MVPPYRALTDDRSPLNQLFYYNKMILKCKRFFEKIGNRRPPGGEEAASDGHSAVLRRPEVGGYLKLAAA